MSQNIQNSMFNFVHEIIFDYTKKDNNASSRVFNVIKKLNSLYKKYIHNLPV